jgi:galactose-1-phosphate uridylyltransferase
VIQKLSQFQAAKLLQAEKLEHLSPEDLVRLVREEIGAAGTLPDGIAQVDPRNGDRVLFNSARAKRPHDNWQPVADEPVNEEECVICRGDTTGIVDITELSRGFTFINKNLYPALYPFEDSRARSLGEGSRGEGSKGARGLHFLQWTSSYHNNDWHNLPLADSAVVMGRLAALEKKLLDGAGQMLGLEKDEDTTAGLVSDQEPGFVLIMKNVGKGVGGSLAHGHQQIALSNVPARRFLEDERFRREKGRPFAQFLLDTNPAGLVIRDYGPALLMVPYFMRRPYDMILLLKGCGVGFLHQMNKAEIAAVAQGWRDAIRAIREIMPGMGREIAFNVITHNGPGAGLYFEFLPFTQESGGFEQMGLFVCQAKPEAAAAQIRQVILDSTP